MMSTNTSSKNENENKLDQSYIVGIGASAGGLEALQKFLTALSPDTGFPYIIVQHLSPDYKSLLGEILGKYTEMPVVQVEDGMEVKKNTVYVIQPGKNMRILNGKLLLSPQREKELNLPIDMFFRSLAEEAGPRAIAIVLSGTGSDGTNGIKEIKEHDGMVIVQNLETSKFDGMPRSAIRTGLVDVQISPEDIALELEHISKAIYRDPNLLSKNEKQVDSELMKKVYIVLKKACNINFSHYKQTTILRRIERRMMLVHKDSLADYVDYLYENIAEVKTLSKEVLIGVTSFFRDPEYFQCLKDKAIQDILLHSSAEEAIRVWVAGCSTGEEAYSIAILFCEAMETLKMKRNVKIFATDLDVDAITTAGKGIYGDSIIDSVSPARLSKFFSRKNSTYVVNRDIRKMIVFSPHNVFQDPPFGRLNLISCRNMLIYFQPVLQNDLFALFHQALVDGGYLFLGKSEAIGAFTDAFPVVDAASKIFSHRSEVKIPGSKVVPFMQTTFLDDDIFEEREQHPARQATISNEKRVDNLVQMNSTIMEQFMPACIVISDKNLIVRIYGKVTNYLHLPTGNFTNNVFDLLAEALKIPASTILKEARAKKTMIQYKDICFHGEQENAKITLTALPISKHANDQDGMYALIFGVETKNENIPDAVVYDIDRVASQRITDLEQELGEVQSKLDKSVAEQECVNEELQAANEELLTANEELQSSNEELQSVNEELYTVNSEYQQKLTELADLNDDIANFLSSTMTGIIFVDNKLNIRRYTDYVTTEFSVMDHDIGRSLKFISYHFPTVDITEICDNVLKTLIPDEREISSSKNKVFFMRVAPYRSTENKILGCVITLIDITAQKQGEVRLESTEEKLTAANRSIEARSDYLSRIVHEIRTPMGTLAGLSKLTLQQEDNKEALKMNLEKINKTIDYMASIVTNITETSRSERNIADVYFEPFSMRRLIDDIQERFEKFAKDQGLEFEVTIVDDFKDDFIGNEIAIEQILSNLINNAIKYTPNGAVGLKVYEDKQDEPKTGKSTVYFVVSDTGMGIKKEFIPDLFTPFTRENNNDKFERVSMGLGLSITKNLINALGGEISVESEEGKGSKFTVKIDLFHNNSKSNKNFKKEVETSAIKFNNTKALIAEDNALNRAILGNLLKEEKIDYVEAVDGDEAVKVFVDSPDFTFDFILMDMRMPKLDGIRATEQIRKSGKTDALTIPIIAVSANGFEEDIRKARESGIDYYTTKPIDRDALLRILSRALHK